MLTIPGPVLLKKNVRQSKYDPAVEEVELIEANPQYAFVKFPNGREATVSIKQLAPSASQEIVSNIPENVQQNNIEFEQLQSNLNEKSLVSTPANDCSPVIPDETVPLSPIRRSSRLSKPPDRLRYDSKF